MKCQENSSVLPASSCLTKAPKTYTGEKTAFLMNGEEKIIYPYYIMLKLGLYLSLYRIKLSGLIA